MFDFTSNRRSFLKKLSIFLGLGVADQGRLTNQLIQTAVASENDVLNRWGKGELTLLNDRPINAECPMHLLDPEVTPYSRLFVRNNGTVPDFAVKQDATGWTLTIDGEVKKKLVFTLEELKTRFKNYTYRLVLECGGNGRAGYFPPAKGNQWTYGAVGCPEWTGVRLKDVLNAAGLKKTAVYTAYYAHDKHLSGDPNKVVISRGTPISKAMEDTTLIAFAMNGKPLPALHGFPARLVVPGYPGSASGKWLKKITIRDRVHDGPKMVGYSYRVPKTPVAPGEKVEKKDMKIILTMPVKSLITHPKSGGKTLGRNFSCRGFAWTGKGKIKAVHVSYDFGQTWIKAKLNKPRNPFAWQRWSAHFQFPTKGYYEIWARATDTNGKMQPMVVPGWNPKGYLNNAMPRISVRSV